MKQERAESELKKAVVLMMEIQRFRTTRVKIQASVFPAFWSGIVSPYQVVSINLQGTILKSHSAAPCSLDCCKAQQTWQNNASSACVHTKFDNLLTLITADVESIFLFQICCRYDFPEPVIFVHEVL